MFFTYIRIQYLKCHQIGRKHDVITNINAISRKIFFFMYNWIIMLAITKLLAKFISLARYFDIKFSQSRIPVYVLLKSHRFLKYKCKISHC